MSHVPVTASDATSTDRDDAWWARWSREAWRRHLPGQAHPERLVARLGEGTVHGLAHRTAQLSPDRPALQIGSAAWTHAELDRMAGQVESWLVDRAAAGERVAIALPSSERWVAAYLGTLRAGCVAVPLNPALTASERDQVADVARPAVTIDDGSPPFAGGGPRPWLERRRPDDVAVLAFTSGTTGRPKGVPLTHRQLLTSIRAAMAAWRWTDADRLVHALPLFHQHGLGGLHATLVAGSRLHLLPRFDAAPLLHEIAVAQATVLFAVPTMYARLPVSSGATTLRLAISGSAPLSREVASTAERALGRVPLVRYGTTESGLDTAQPYTEPRTVEQAETVGIPLPGVELRLDPAGEIQLRGPQVFAGYWRDAEPAAAFAAGGWFRTGDLGALDAATGHLLITGRIKEVIITGGLKVNPREVELTLERHPGVLEAAVAGLPSAEWGEEVVAWIVPRPGASVSGAELIAHARSSLAPYKCPKRVVQVAALPRNHMGKIDRRALQQPHAQEVKPDGSTAG